MGRFLFDGDLSKSPRDLHQTKLELEQTRTREESATVGG